MAQIYLVVAITAVLVLSHGTNAKRGCSAFGHSCFGGHGKRSENAVMDTNVQILPGNQLGQEETAPHPVYPHSGYSGVLPPGDDIIPIRDGGVYDENPAREAMKFKLRNLARNWMDNYRRSQSQQNDDGYYIETL